ncbi:branched-chain amino acid ABC transporter, ATP-binding protein, putative [Pyrobaculum aerophilum str. IM2]|uniref:Branched-chain amino acid ABC transporter, ATP-binding protein, putative n=2 Tax=Pyrobaculum aerophilum TaxID=13773 RepID=Q8ZXB5_PYRAE|nr:ATP-binding cassette domain-containing protein [Pyrobaculum aerophilum]AAL63434.1 branched-chain amino acid ABC transporter, ATP-binding protein, putative [Pyrobaculum aerophilum str. IM2]HII45967.1 ATP-binding cassette domain-containing protein [Pyrobaculum aerophilum]
MEIKVSLYKKFRGFQLAVNASFSLPALFLGPNGSGKSTALKCIAGLYTCGGKVELDGKAAGGDSFLYVPPAPRIPPTLTVEEYLAHVSEIFGVDVKPALGVDKFLKKRGSELSSGMAARAVLAAALSTDRILLLDEPLSYLESDVRIELVKALKGRAFIAATHDPGPFLPLRPSVVAISEGKSVRVGSWEEVAGWLIRDCGGDFCVEKVKAPSLAGYGL